MIISSPGRGGNKCMSSVGLAAQRSPISLISFWEIQSFKLKAQSI